MTLRREHALALVVLTIVIAVGAYLRLSHLRAYNLIQEELSHYYVGNAIAHGEPPALPSGRWYTRAVEYSRLVSLSSAHIASPEIAIRLPSALLGILCLIVMAAGTWAMAGPWAAAGATFLLAIYPEAVAQSRLGRFYMLQMLAFLLAFFVGWVTIQKRLTTSALKTWLGMIFVTFVLLYAARTQVTALPSLFAFWLCLTIAGFRDILQRRATWRNSAPIQFAAATLFALLALLFIHPILIDKVIVRAISMPYWARVRAAPIYFYATELLHDLSVVVLVSPFAFLYVLRKRFALGTYLMAMAGIPAFMFSLVLPLKAERFLLLATPPLFIAVAIGTASACNAAFTSIRSRLQRTIPEERKRNLLAAAPVGLLLVIALLSMRTPRTAWTSHWDRIEPKWDQAALVLNARPDLKHIPYGATKSLPPRFYWGRIDFNIGRNFLEQWTISPLAEAGVSSGRVGAYRTLPIGSPDLYAGVPVLTTAESIRQRFREAGGVVIGIDGQARYFGMVDSTLLNILERDGEKLCTKQCGALTLYFWRFK